MYNCHLIKFLRQQFNWLSTSSRYSLWNSQPNNFLFITMHTQERRSCLEGLLPVISVATVDINQTVVQTHVAGNFSKRTIHLRYCLPDTWGTLLNLLTKYRWPMFAGLFHRVVLSSGSALSPWASVHDPNDLRLKVAEQIGCSTENDEDIADCLRGVPLRELMAVELPEIR